MASGRTAEGGLCHSERASVQEAGQAARQHQQPVRAVGVLHTPLRIGAVRPRTSQQQPVGYASHASHASTLSVEHHHTVSLAHRARDLLALQAQLHVPRQSSLQLLLLLQQLCQTHLHAHAQHHVLVADRLRRLAQALWGHHPISKPLHQL